MQTNRLLVLLLVVPVVVTAQSAQRSPTPYKTPRDLYHYDTILFSGSVHEPMPTQVKIKKNDFVYIEVYGTVKVGPYLGDADGAGLLQNSLFAASYNKYKGHRHGSLMVLLNGQPESCKRILDDLGGKYSIPGITPDYGIKYVPGYYFIANQDTKLSFDINDADPFNNSGRFIISVVTMSYEQHLARNFFNRCPEKEPVDGKDCLGNTWVEESIKSWWYHGINDSFRGGTANAGCQCVYDSDTLITVGENKGSFDIGYWHFKGDLNNPRAHYYHLVLDVIPHDLFVDKMKAEPNYRYQKKVSCK